MAWIETIDEESAQGRLQELYGRMTEPWGGVDNILKIHSLNPASLRGHFDLYKVLMRGRSPLSRAQREMIAVVVSSINQCHY
ncbi:MAG: carboxymuconolactone decarboxylase family protein [Deltaproteobacteria bacterium]|nr:carboxymuconolactone decarboxylase family protein [Deltaproteobacteria bacterium]